MDVTAVLQLLRYGNQLKRTPRTGWVQRGVPDPENVAAHSYNVIFTVMVLGQLLDEPVDVPRAMALATIHDLPEALTTDIPAPAWRRLPDGVKDSVEREAMQTMVADSALRASFMALWEEMNAQETAASRLADDADKLELYLQALIYEEQTGNRWLSQFWQTPRTFHYPQTQALYDELRAAHRRLQSAAGTISSTPE